MERYTFRDYLMCDVTRTKRETLVRKELTRYERALRAARLPVEYLSAVGYGIRREALMQKRVELLPDGTARVCYDDMDEDEIVHRYENRIG